MTHQYIDTISNRIRKKLWKNIPIDNHGENIFAIHFVVLFCFQLNNLQHLELKSKNNI